MNARTPTLAAIPVLLAALCAGLAGCSNAPRTESAAPETVNDVHVIVAGETTQPDWLEAIGTVRASQTSQVASQMMGTILEIHVREGDKVRASQVLAVLDDAQPQAAVAQAAAAVAAAEKEVIAADSDVSISQSTLQRYQQLYEKKSVSPQEFDEISARRQSAEARRDLARAQQAQASAALNQARIALAYVQIRAPFDGIVTEKKAEPGALATPGAPLFTVEDARGFRLEVTVDERDVQRVRVG